MVSRLKGEVQKGIEKYVLNISFLRRQEIDLLMEKYVEITENIIKKRKNNEDISYDILKINEIKNKISDGQNNIDRKNIIKGTSKTDKRIGSGKDNNVYSFEDNGKYVYKESGESNIDNLEYSKKKYLILKKYLGDFIPRSYFMRMIF